MKEGRRGEEGREWEEEEAEEEGKTCRMIDHTHYNRDMNVVCDVVCECMCM